MALSSLKTIRHQQQQHVRATVSEGQSFIFCAGMGPDVNKLNSDMRDELEICQHQQINKNVEMELLNSWKYD